MAMCVRIFQHMNPPCVLCARIFMFEKNMILIPPLIVTALLLNRGISPCRRQRPQEASQLE
jgi:hypothetical protein